MQPLSEVIPFLKDAPLREEIESEDDVSKTRVLWNDSG